MRGVDIIIVTIPGRKTRQVGRIEGRKLGFGLEMVRS